MHKRFIKPLRSIRTMAKSNLSSWIHSPRTLIMLLFVIAFCFLVTNNYIQGFRGLDYELHFFEALFVVLYTGCSITTTSILFLVTISELPKRIGYQYSNLIRSSRIEWMASQIVYCMWMALGMLVLTVMSASIFLLFNVPIGNTWSDTARIGTEVIQESQALIPSFFRNTFTPLEACLFAMLPMYLFWFTMILVVLLFSLCQLPMVGLMTYALMLVANIVLMVESFSDLPLPIYYATIGNITTGWIGKEMQKVNEAFMGYGVAIICLLICMFLIIRKIDLCFQAEE